jgi:Spy/CpxP family protein refolding chaperone
MKTWKKVALALGLALVVGSGTAAALAANGHRGGNFQQRITARVNRMLDKLNATPDQRQAINQITNDALGQLQAVHQQQAQNHGFWMKALTDTTVTEGQLDEQADAHAAQMAATAKKIIIPALLKVRNVLTDAQRQQLATMMKNHAPQGGFGGPEQ